MLLVALWLVATQHCGLEASGLFAHEATAEAGAGCCSSNQTTGCEADGCKAVEEGQFRADTQILKATAPDLFACACRLCCDLLLTPPPGDAGLAVKDRWDEAPAWVPAWQFERRAAAPAHAPDVVIA